MLKLKEVMQIIIVIILFAFIISFPQILKENNQFIEALVFAFIILAVNILAKKITAYYYDSKIEQKILHWRRWGYYKRSQLKKPIPIGILLPFLLVWISYPTGFIKMLTFLQSEITPTSARVSRRRGGVIQRHLEMTEFHLSVICGIGIVANLVLALVAGIFDYGRLARFSVYFCIWNLLPLGQVDGSKILFGSKLLWLLLAVLSVVGLFCAIFFM